MTNIDFKKIYEGVWFGRAVCGGYDMPTSPETDNAHVLKVDLQNGKIGFFLTPAGWLTPNGVTVPQFVDRAFDSNSMSAMLAINANFGDPDNGARNVFYGLFASDGDALPAAPNHPNEDSSLIVLKDNRALIGTTQDLLKQYPVGAAGTYWAVTGSAQILTKGSYTASTNTDGDPLVRHARTVVGLSEDTGNLNQQYLYLAVIDGLDAGGQGATFEEAADFMFQVGAYDAVNLDGGGSSTMVKCDKDVGIVVLNETCNNSVSNPSGDPPFRALSTHFGVVVKN